MLNFSGPFSSTHRPKVYRKESDHDRVMTGILTQTLTALSILKGLGSRLESLSINHIRDFPDPNFPPNEDLRPLLEGLKTLNLHMTEPWDSQKCSRFSSEKCHPVQRLLNHWLAPTHANLTTLSLFHDSFWGWLPKVDFRPIKLPRLRVLALGNFSFAYDIHFEWLTSLGNSLEALYLDDCPLVCAVKGAELLNPDRPPTMDDLVDTKTGTLSWTYCKPRSYHLPRLAMSLVKLRWFVMGHGRWWQEKAAPFVEYEDMDTSKKYLCQYVHYDCSEGSVRWYWYWDGSGSRLPDWPEHEEEDAVERRKLWSVTEKRRSLATADSFICTAVP